MKIVFLRRLFLLGPAIAYSQRKPTNTVCLKTVPPGVILNICTHERVWPRPRQPRLYLRVFHGRACRYEVSKDWDDLVKRIPDHGRRLQEIVPALGYRKLSIF